LPALPIAYWFGELAPKLAQSWRERPDGFLTETDLSHLTIAVPSTARPTGHQWRPCIRAGGGVPAARLIRTIGTRSGEAAAVGVSVCPMRC